jgi:hypothetical protein
VELAEDLTGPYDDVKAVSRVSEKAIAILDS